MSLRAVGYSRLSKEDINKSENNTSESIKNQNLMIADYVSEHGWLLQDIYSDDDFKGSDRSRPEFNRLISDMYADKFDIIVCKSQSRFARDIELVEKYIHGIFLERGIRFITLEDHIDTAEMNNSAKKISQLHGLTDTWYLEDLSHNVKEVLKMKRKKGEYLGSWGLYGYFKDPDNKNRLIVDPVAAEVVKEIYNLYLEGYGLMKIANILNDRNVPNPLKYKKELGMKIGAASRLTSKSYMWRNATIGSILDNQMYIGNMVQGKMRKVSYKSKKLVRVPREDWVIVENTHEAIIDKETWERVQNIRKNKIKPRRNGMVNIFSGKIRCSECNELMYAITYPKIINGKRSETEFYTMFRCSKKMMNKKACSSKGMAVSKLESFVLAELKKLTELYFDEEFIGKQLSVKDLKAEELEKLLMEENRLELNIKEKNQAAATLYLDKVKGILTEKQFVALNRQFYEDIQQSEKALQRIEKEKKKLLEEQDKEVNLSEIISKYKNIEKLDRNVVTQLIDCIYIGSEDEETKERIIKIVWNL